MISVIIPVYNVEKYIEQCLDSVINQTYRDIEIICVDNCSSDNSLAIIEKLAQKDNRIKIICQKENNGPGIARNIGIDAAAGDYIFFLDSDDYLLPDALEKLYEKSLETKSDIVVTHTEAFPNDDSEEIKKRTISKNNWINRVSAGHYQVQSDNYIDFIDKHYFYAWGKLYNKEFITKNNLKFINKNATYEDNGFWLKLCSCFPQITYINHTGMMYRVRSGSITLQTDKNLYNKNVLIIIKDAFEYFDTYKKKDAKIFKDAIKSSKIYYYLFEKSCGFLYKIRWAKYNKLIKILGIPLYREKMEGEYKKIRILGVPLCKFNCKKELK